MLSFDQDDRLCLETQKERGKPLRHARRLAARLVSRPSQVFAQTALRRREMDPGAVMTTGGWDSVKVLQTYLTTLTPEEVAEEFAEKWEA